MALVPALEDTDTIVPLLTTLQWRLPYWQWWSRPACTRNAYGDIGTGEYHYGVAVDRIRRAAVVFRALHRRLAVTGGLGQWWRSLENALGLWETVVARGGIKRLFQMSRVLRDEWERTPPIVYVGDLSCWSIKEEVAWLIVSWDKRFKDKKSSSSRSHSKADVMNFVRARCCGERFTSEGGGNGGIIVDLKYLEQQGDCGKAKWGNTPQVECDESVKFFSDGTPDPYIRRRDELYCSSSDDEEDACPMNTDATLSEQPVEQDSDENSDEGVAVVEHCDPFHVSVHMDGLQVARQAERYAPTGPPHTAVGGVRAVTAVLETKSMPYLVNVSETVIRVPCPEGTAEGEDLLSCLFHFDSGRIVCAKGCAGGDEKAAGCPNFVTAKGLEEPLQFAKAIRCWIFTPSHHHEILNGFDRSRLYRPQCYVRRAEKKENETPMKAFEDYIEVIVVKSADWDKFVNAFGSTHMLIRLPDSFEVDANHVGRHPELKVLQGTYRRRLHRRVFRSDVGGIGYARMFLQLLSYHWGLHATWVLDGGIMCALKMTPASTLAKTAKHGLDGDEVDGSDSRLNPGMKDVEAASFSEIMEDAEEVFFGKEKSISIHRLWTEEDGYGEFKSGGEQENPTTARSMDRSINFLASQTRIDGGRVVPCPIAMLPSDENPTKKLHPLRSRKPPPPPPDGPIVDWTDNSDVRYYCGSGPSQFAMLGIFRGRWYKSTKHPFSASRPYSFILLNIRLTVQRRALYVPKRPWQDLELINVLEEKQLVICKMMRFTHIKVAPLQLTRVKQKKREEKPLQEEKEPLLVAALTKLGIDLDCKMVCVWAEDNKMIFGLRNLAWDRLESLRVELDAVHAKFGELCDWTDATQQLGVVVLCTETVDFHINKHTTTEFVDGVGRYFLRSKKCSDIVLVSTELSPEILESFRAQESVEAVTIVAENNGWQAVHLHFSG